MARSLRLWAGRVAGFAAVVTSLAAATGVTGSPASANPALPAAPTPGFTAPASTSCSLANGIKHVIHFTFDNVHFYRDNPNVPSDLEQMPNLLNFLEGNGTLLSNNHTPLIAHTANDSLTQYTGLYGDRHGMGVSNSYEYYNGANVNSADSFIYWTSPIIDHGSQTPSATDLNPSMVYSQNVPPAPVASTTGHDAMAPAPWAAWTRAGCSVGDFSTANMVLEKPADVPTAFGAGSPEDQGRVADPDTAFKDDTTDNYLGESIHCGQATGVNDPLCTGAQAVKFGQTAPSPSAVPDVLPDEPGGYANFVALHGFKYLNPVLSGGVSTVRNGYPVSDAGGNLTDLDGNTINGAFKDKHEPFATSPSQFNPGFPGFSPTASQSLAYIADMQEAGVPVTYGYISDVHEKKTTAGVKQSGCTSPGNALSLHRDARYHKQLNASVGRFGTAALVLDTAALRSGNSTDDMQYSSTLAAIASLGAQRDALATTKGSRRLAV
jgi:hypothetical protein